MNFVQENYQNHDDRTCGDATKPEPKMLACFQQNLTPEQFDQVIAASNDEDDPPANVPCTHCHVSAIHYCCHRFRAFHDFQTEGRNEFRAGKQSKS